MELRYNMVKPLKINDKEPILKEAKEYIKNKTDFFSEFMQSRRVSTVERGQ
jgi:hypothetical protein